MAAMLILAIDTTSEEGGVGVFRDAECLALVPNQGQANQYSITLFELVEKALRTLPAAQRVPLVLFHMEGLQYDEIAAKLGVSMGKVKTDIFRARETLRRKLRLTLSGEDLAGAA